MEACPLIHSTNSAAGLPQAATETKTRCDNPRGYSRKMCEHEGIFWTPIRCRKCEGCDRHRASVAVAKIRGGLVEGVPAVFLTLTTRAGAAWPRIMAAWSRLVRVLRRQHGHFEYSVVKEEGKASGMRHLHAILVGQPWYSKDVIKREWCRLTGAFIVDVRRVDKAGLGAYLAKYLGKGALVAKKVLTLSRGWYRAPRPKWLSVANFSGPPEARAWALPHPSGILVEYWGRAGPCRCVGWAIYDACLMGV